VVNIQAKINKILKALELQGKIYLINYEQIYSNNFNKVITRLKLYKLIPVEEYNKLYPDKKKDPKKYNKVKVEILKTYNKTELLMKLVEIYKGGEIDG